MNDVLEDAQRFSEHRTAPTTSESLPLNRDDVRLAVSPLPTQIHMFSLFCVKYCIIRVSYPVLMVHAKVASRLDFNFSAPPPQEFLLEIADAKNKTPLKLLLTKDFTLDDSRVGNSILNSLL